MSPDSRVETQRTQRSQDRHQDSLGDTELEAEESSIARGEVGFGRLRKFGCLLSESGILFRPKIHQTLKMPEFRELLLHQKSENYGVTKALREVSLGQTPNFTGKGTEASYNLLCSLRLFTISPVPAVMASSFEPKKSEGISLACPRGSSWDHCCPPHPVTLVPEYRAQWAKWTCAELFPPYLPACLLAPPHPP